MELIVLGAGPAYTDRPGAAGAAYLVRNGETAVLLDLGQGAFPNLAGELEPSTLDAVFVSHLHPDHFVDLVALRHYLQWEFRPPRRVSVWGPADLVERLDGVAGEPGFAQAVLGVEGIGERTVDVGGLEVEARRVTHTDASYAFRVSERVRLGLVYSGDCGVADDLEPLIRPGDVLLSEVAFGPGPVVPGALHLDGPAVGRLAAKARVRRVLLTHIQMGFDREATVRSVCDSYDGAVEFVDPGARIPL